MSSKVVLHYADFAIAIGCFAMLALLAYRKALRTYAFLAALLAVRGTWVVVATILLFYRKEFDISIQRSYNVYFYGYWQSSILESVLQILVIYSVYRIAMRPLDGLKRIGSVIFLWVSTVSILLSVVVALGPHAQGFDIMATLIGQVQQGVSVLTVCLLVFVCFAARPLGLDFRSRGFGVALGLGLNSTAGLVLSAWFSSSSAESLYSSVFAAGAIASVVSMAVWGVYFAVPEPARKLVTLPTTSPYFLWNSISEAMGDDPGVVGLAGFTPAMLSTAEILALTSPSEGASPSKINVGPMPSPAMAAGF